MDHFYTHTFDIDTTDVDLWGHCRPSALLGLLQEAATGAANDIGLSREGLLERCNGFWMLVRLRYTLKRPLRWEDRLTLRTWHRGGKAAMTYREYDLLVDGEEVGRALAAWVLADNDTHKLMRLEAVGKDYLTTTGGSLCRTETLAKLHLPEGMAPVGRRRMHYSDTDINGHVNNSRYADFACDALPLEEVGRGKFVSSLQVNFLAECLAGETLTLETCQDGGRWFVSGMDEERKVRFNSEISLG